MQNDLAKVRVVNSGGQWMNTWMNPEAVHYIQPVDGNGDFSGHFVIGFQLREFVCHKDDIKLLFEI